MLLLIAVLFAAQVPEMTREEVTAIQMWEANYAKEQAQKAAAEKQHSMAMAALTATHPDVPKHEPRMTALAKKLAPAQGVGRYEYLKLLYDVAVALDAKEKK